MFTLDELIEFIGSKPDLEGYKSTREWAEELGVNILRMREIIRLAKERGIVKQRRIPFRDIANHDTTVDGYKFIVHKGEPEDASKEDG